MSKQAIARTLRKIAAPYATIGSLADDIEQMGAIEQHLVELKLERDSLVIANAKSRDAAKKEKDAFLADLKAARESWAILEKKSDDNVSEAADKAKKLIKDAIGQSQAIQYESTKEEKNDLTRTKNAQSIARSQLKNLNTQLQQVTEAVTMRENDLAVIEQKITDLRKTLSI